MISVDEVIELYRALLGRAPESADTIKAFQGYYPSYERGRKAIFGSDEFVNFFGQVTGKMPAAADAGTLALAFMARAGAAALPKPQEAANPAIRDGLQPLFVASAARPAPRFGMVVGDLAGLRLEDLAPFAEPGAILLHIAPGFPPLVPLVRRLENGTIVFCLAAEAASICAVLDAHCPRIDVLYLLGAPAGADWAAALRPMLAARMPMVIGPAHQGFDAASISAAIELAHHCEGIQNVEGLRVHHFGTWLLPVRYEPPAVLPAPPDRTAYPKLAIAAIVRSEENCIENMLRSAVPVASFFAVLDTGSEDGTFALAQRFLASSGVPFALAQQDRAALNHDFSAMRNTALSMVPTNMDWVLMLDADEELVAEDYALLLELVASARHEVFALPRYNFPGPDKQGLVTGYPDRQVRLLRNTPDRRIRYSGYVHEKIRFIEPGYPLLDSTAAGGPRGGPHIHHLVRRFKTPEQEDRKQADYRDIIRRHGPQG